MCITKIIIVQYLICNQMKYCFTLHLNIVEKRTHQYTICPSRSVRQKKRKYIYVINKSALMWIYIHLVESCLSITIFGHIFKNRKLSYVLKIIILLFIYCRKIQRRSWKIMDNLLPKTFEELSLKMSKKLFSIVFYKLELISKVPHISKILLHG